MFSYKNLFKKKDPICKMKEEKGKGFTKNNFWFCSQNCLKQYEKKSMHKDKCCH